MQFIQAKRIENKLGVDDNRPFAIDGVRFIDNGFELLLSDEKGKDIRLTYNSLDWFREDFNIVNSVRDLEGYRRFNKYI